MGITEDSASVRLTTEGSAEGLAEGTFGRSLIFSEGTSEGNTFKASSAWTYSSISFFDRCLLAVHLGVRTSKLHIYLKLRRSLLEIVFYSSR